MLFNFYIAVTSYEINFVVTTVCSFSSVFSVVCVIFHVHAKVLQLQKTVNCCIGLVNYLSLSMC